MRRLSPYAAAYLISFVLCLPVATSCAALGFQPLPNPHSIGSPVCGGQMPVLIDMKLTHVWSVRVREAVEFWNKAIGYRALVVFGRYDFEDMYKHGLMSTRNPYVTINKISLDQEVEYRNKAEDTARRLGRPVQYVAATTYVHYGMQGTLQACVRGARVMVYEDDGYYSDDEQYYALLHELGHALGLGVRSHSREPGTIMYSEIRVTEYGEVLSEISLGDDTMREIRALYPRSPEDVDSVANEQ